MIDPRNGPAHDLPPPPVPRRTFVIASSPRCGSTLLCRALWDLGVAAPKEYLNGMQVRDWEVRGAEPRALRWGHRMLRGRAVALAGRGRWSDRRLARYLARIQARRTGPGGWFGIKVHWHHYARWFVRSGRRPATYFGPIRWIRIRRTDRLAQAVSWARARQTDRWVHDAPERGRARITHRAVDARLAAIDEADRGWDHTLPDGVLELHYEDLVHDWEGSLARVLDRLGVAHPRGGWPAPSLRVQRDGRTDAWMAGLRDAGYPGVRALPSRIGAPLDRA